MTEHTSPSLVEVSPTATISPLLTDRVARDPRATLVERRITADGPWERVTAQEFEDDVVAVARGLLARGIEPGDHVAIMSRTRYEWTLLDFAAWAVGAVPVPVYETSSAEQKTGTGSKRKIFHWAAKVAITWSRALDAPGGPALGLRLQHAVADRLVYSTLRAAMGGRLTYSISGGAPLGERLGHFYRGVGLRILEGYGLTETTAPTAVNLPGLTKIGTVGPAFPGT